MLTNRQIENPCKAFANHTSTDIKLSKAQLTKILGLTTPVSATDATINKKILGSGTTTLIISNYEMYDILKIVKSLEDSGVLLKGVNETIKKEAKEQKGGFLSMLLGTLGATLLGNTLTSKGVIRAAEGSKGSSLKKI